MRPQKVQKIARAYGLVVRPGGKHHRLETPDGKLVCVAALGVQKERGPKSPEAFLKASIEKALRQLR